MSVPNTSGARARADWERERSMRVDAAASLVHNLAAAQMHAGLAGAAPAALSNIGFERDRASALLQRTLNEENPYAGRTQ